MLTWHVNATLSYAEITLVLVVIEKSSTSFLINTKIITLILCGQVLTTAGIQVPRAKQVPLAYIHGKLTRKLTFMLASKLTYQWITKAEGLSSKSQLASVSLCVRKWLDISIKSLHVTSLCLNKSCLSLIYCVTFSWQSPVTQTEQISKQKKGNFARSE